MITLEQITEFFKDTHALNVAENSDWNIDQACIWSYYFVDEQPQVLANLAKHLADKGYDVIDITEEDEDYVLQVDCVETHTPESLFNLGVEFEALVKKFNVRDYDGMDVSAYSEG